MPPVRQWDADNKKDAVRCRFSAALRLTVFSPAGPKSSYLMLCIFGCYYSTRLFRCQGLRRNRRKCSLLPQTQLEDAHRTGAQSSQPLPDAHWPYQLVVTGEAGFGKPRLAAVAKTRARQRGWSWCRSHYFEPDREEQSGVMATLERCGPAGIHGRTELRPRFDAEISLSGQYCLGHPVP